jgi:hypothetical protein
VYDLRVDGEAHELLLVSPQGSGVSAAFASMAVRDVWRQLAREHALPADPAAAAKMLLEAYDDSPLARPVSLLVVRVEKGRVRGVSAGFAAPSLIAAESMTPVALGPAIEPAPPRLRGPLRPFELDLAGATLAFYDDGEVDPRMRRLTPDEALRRLQRALAKQAPGDAAQEVADEAAKRARKRHGDDILCVAIRSAG